MVTARLPNPRPTPTLRIAILAPMRSELAPLIELLQLRRSRDGEDTFLYGTSGRAEVVAALTGIGMRAGARRAAEILDAQSPDHLIVVGIAGGIGSSVAIGDLIVPEHVLDLETGETFLPARLGGEVTRGTLASSDALLSDPMDAAALRNRGVIAIDMETAAIAAVCSQRGCPFSVFRAVSDRADDGTTDAAVLGLADSNGNPDLVAVARFVLTQPRRIPQLVRLARGAKTAARAAAVAAADAIASI